MQSTARRELDAIHTALLEAHPGAIDDENPSYRARIDTGYAAALGRLPEVRDERDAMALSNWYLASFRDGHLHASNGVLAGDKTIVSGWAIARAADGRARVTAIVPDWPALLPAVGDELLACDGRAPERLVAEDVLPYAAPMSMPMRDTWALPQLSNPAMSSLRYAACRFRGNDGRERSLPQHYQPVGEAVMAAVFWRTASPRGITRVDDFEQLGDGTLWIRAGNFQLDASGENRLREMLGRLERLPPARRIVFDVRGNNGGSSDTGERIFTAATGGLVYDQEGLDKLPRVRAWWRISPATIAAMGPRIEYASAALGPDAPLVRGQVAWRDQMSRALARGDRWLPQGDGFPRMTPDELVRRHAHLARFAGPVALVTDGACASACLDFADLVRSVPGALQLGETTAFDSVYLEVGGLPLPSGNSLMLPLKVWRNRLRGNDQPWVPQVPIGVTNVDDARVRATVLAALDRAGR